jgi:hypothetical protein
VEQFGKYRGGRRVAFTEFEDDISDSVSAAEPPDPIACGRHSSTELKKQRERAPSVCRIPEPHGWLVPLAGFGQKRNDRREVAV